MLESYDATLADLKRQRDEIDRLIEGLTKFRASRAADKDSSVVETKGTVVRQKRNGTKASQICAAAESFLRECGAPQSTSAILIGMSATAGDLDQPSLSSYLSKSPKFYSKNREWHLEAWRVAAVPGNASLPAQGEGTTSHDSG